MPKQNVSFNKFCISLRTYYSFFLTQFSLEFEFWQLGFGIYLGYEINVMNLIPCGPFLLSTKSNQLIKLKIPGFQNC